MRYVHLETPPWVRRGDGHALYLCPRSGAPRPLSCRAELWNSGFELHEELRVRVLQIVLPFALVRTSCCGSIGRLHNLVVVMVSRMRLCSPTSSGTQAGYRFALPWCFCAFGHEKQHSVLMMATTANQVEDTLRYQDEDFSDTDFDDEESVASLETDDGEDHEPESILAEFSTKTGNTWYLVKWQDCPILRSSWEGQELSVPYPAIAEAWHIERQKQREGKSKPFDIPAFERKVLDVELAERRRRVLRRLKRKINRVLSIVSD